MITIQTLPGVSEARVAPGPSIASRAQLSRSRERIQGIIDQAAFHPVFQPIVDLASLSVIGYEALTRFDDGIAPDVQFGAAASVGLGVELEVAALRAALAAATALPAMRWLNVNASPAVVLAGEPLRSLVAGYPGHVVLEVTEHAVINDCTAFRLAVGALGSDVHLPLKPRHHVTNGRACAGTRARETAPRARAAPCGSRDGGDRHGSVSRWPRSRGARRSRVEPGAEPEPVAAAGLRRGAPEPGALDCIPQPREQRGWS